MSLYINIEKELPFFKLNVNINNKSDILGLLGQSGCGKTLTLKCIAGLETPTKGKIVLNDRVLFDSENNINVAVQKRNVGYLFQNYALFPHLNVRENIEIGLFKLDNKKKKEIVNLYIKKLRLKELEKKYPYQLSGGQSQRVALARVLVTEPEILLLDEPFSALDLNLRRNIEIELMEILKEYKKDVILVTHDIEEAYRMCSNISTYDNGISSNSRKVEDLFERPYSLIEAKLTGCKNISKIKIINKNKIYAMDWGYELDINKDIKDNINYLGIRSHNIKLSKSCTEDSIFKIKKIIKNINSYTLFIENKNINNNNYIEVDLYEDKLEFDIGDLVDLNINEDNLLLFS